MGRGRQLDRDSVQRAVEKARLIVAARAELAALEAEQLVEFQSVEELFAVVDKGVRATKVAGASKIPVLAHV